MQNQPSLRSDGQWWVERDDGWYFFDQAGQRWVKQGAEKAPRSREGPGVKPERPGSVTLARLLRSKILLAVAGLAIFLLGVGVGSVGPDETVAEEEAAEAREDVAQLEAELSREEDARESATQSADDLSDEVNELRNEVASLERELEESGSTRGDTSGDGGGGGGGEGGGSAGGGPATSAARSFGDGTWRVGEEIQPGTYRAPGGSNCYWERLRNFKGGLNSIIVNGGFNKNQTVTIAASDAGFSTSGCGTWQPL